MGSTSVRGGQAGLRVRLPDWRAAAGRLDPVLVGLVLVIAVVAFLTHDAYTANLRDRWAGVYHDRNAHYQAGLNVACELRNLHLVQAVLDLDAASMAWPVFHPLCLAAVLTVAGPTPTAAVLPSLFGWCGATLFGFLIARRLSGGFGWAGGLVTAALFLSSTALRALGTDVMLESLGLCLSLATIHAYLVFSENPTRRSGALLGVALACLFLQKYNYWGLTVVALTATEFLRRPLAILTGVRTALRMVDWSAWASAQFRRPLNSVIAALLGVSLAAALNGGVTLGAGGKSITIKETRIFVSAAYGLFLLRLAWWWWPTGKSAATRLAGEPAVSLATWAAIPVLVWFTLPFRLHYFLWYAGPGNNPGVLKHTPLEAFRFYSGCFVGDYHAVALAAGVAAVLAGIGLAALLLRRDTPAGWLAVPGAFFLCGTLTILHPNQQLRFLHSWAPLLWVVAGVGVAAVLQLLSRFAGEAAGRVVAVAAVVGVAVGLASVTPAVARPGPAFGSGYQSGPSLREVYDAYLPYLDGQTPTALLANLPDASWRWGFMERFGHKDELRHNLREIGAFDPVTPDAAAKWVQTTKCRTVVYVEVPRTSPLYEAPMVAADNSAIKAAMLSQTTFRLEHTIRVRNLATVYIWRR